MALRVYNTLSGKKEEFKPLSPPKVGIYACGVTVYDYCHIGHARAAVAFDVIARYLRFAGYDVTYVRNYTDIDDKIINRSNEQGVDWKELTETFIEAHDADMGAPGCAEGRRGAQGHRLYAPDHCHRENPRGQRDRLRGGW